MACWTLQGLLSHTWSRPDAARHPFAKPRRFIKTHKLKPKIGTETPNPKTEIETQNPKPKTEN
jgi:hypothetical protein